MKPRRREESRLSDRRIEVHVGSVVVKMKLLTFNAECRFYGSEKLLQGVVLRPCQVVYLHNEQNMHQNVTWG